MNANIGERTTSKNGPPRGRSRLSRTTKRKSTPQAVALLHAVWRHPAARRPVEREVHCMARCPVETWLLDCGCALSRTLASIIPTSSPLPPRSWNAKSAGCAVVLATRPCPQGVLPRSARWIMRGARPLESGRAVRNTQHPTPSSPPLCHSVLQESLRSRCCKQPWLHALSHGYSGCRIRVYIACFIFPARGVAEPSVVPLAVARFDHTRHHRVLKR